MITDPTVASAVRDLERDPANKDLPEQFWNDLAIELSDIRYYYIGGMQLSPSYHEARTFAEDAVKSWHERLRQGC